MRKFILCLFLWIKILGEGSEITFESANLEQAEFLTDLALKSNAIYHYRCVSDAEARPVFLVQEQHFQKGVIRIMKDEGKLIGFFGLASWTEENGSTTNILSHLFLEPEFIGKGYGKILFLEAVRVAKEELHWEAFQWESDPNAAWFYRKMRAKQLGENQCRLNPNHKTPVFVYTLKP